MPKLIPAERSSLVVAQAAQRRLADERRLQGLLRDDLSERTGLSPYALGRVERAELDMPLSRFVQVCRALGLSPAAVLKEQGLG